jgi:Icc-related predicted phosphoesterase
MTSSPEWPSSVLRLVCLSDTHSQHATIDLPAGDVLLHAGDFTTWGTRDQLEDFDQWLGRQDFRHKVVVPGNHDNAMDPFVRSIVGDSKDKTGMLLNNIVKMKADTWNGDDAAAKGFLKNATVLIDDTVEIEGLVIFGSPHTHPSGQENREGSRCNAFKYVDEDRFEERLGRLKGANVVITHSPPFGILDTVKDGFATTVIAASSIDKQVGSPALARLVRQEQPALHIFGHIHECRGLHREHGVTWANVANSGRPGEQLRPATVVDIDRNSKRVVSVRMEMK